MNKIEGLAYYYISMRHRFKWVYPNVYIDENEVDLLHITDSGYAYFYEVKASLSDFRNDLKKPRHKLLLERSGKLLLKPKQFIYLTYGFEIPPDEIPEYAGVLRLSKYGVNSYKNGDKVTPTIFNEKVPQGVINTLNQKMIYRYMDKRIKLTKNIRKTL